MLLKKVLNVSGIFVSSATISPFSERVIFELLDTFLSENNGQTVFKTTCCQL